MFHVPLRPDDHPGEPDFAVVDQGIPSEAKVHEGDVIAKLPIVPLSSGPFLHVMYPDPED